MPRAKSYRFIHMHENKIAASFLYCRADLVSPNTFMCLFKHKLGWVLGIKENT